METTAEKSAENAAPELNAPENTGQSEPVNAVAQEIQPGQLLKPRGRGRPPGSKTKNRRGADGKFLRTGEQQPQPGQPQAAPQPGPAPEFISSIPGQDNGPSAPASPEPSTAQKAAQQAGIDYRAMAVMTVGLTTGVLEKVVGPEWKAESEDEFNSIVLPLEAYLRVKQCPDIPPGALLAIAILGYSARRLSAPSTKGKLVRAWYWLKGKFTRRKYQMPAIYQPKPKPQPQPEQQPQAQDMQGAYDHYPQ